MIFISPHFDTFRSWSQSCISLYVFEGITLLKKSWIFKELSRFYITKHIHEKCYKQTFIKLNNLKLSHPLLFSDLKNQSDLNLSEIIFLFCFKNSLFPAKPKIFLPTVPQSHMDWFLRMWCLKLNTNFLSISYRKLIQILKSLYKFVN